MKKYLNDYIVEVENKKKITQKDKDELLIKIKFFSHERLVHLIVTISFVIFSIMFTFMSFYTEKILFYVVTLVLYIIDIFYILHYYALENGVKKLYKIFDKLNSK